MDLKYLSALPDDLRQESTAVQDGIRFIIPEPKRLMPRDYLGDSVYAAFDGNGIILTTENGEPIPSNIIYLEPDVYAALLRFVERVKTQSAQPPPQ